MVKIIDEILFDLSLPWNKGWGLEGSDGECAVMFGFCDGYAFEVKRFCLDEYIPVPESDDPILLFYPTIDEVEKNEWLVRQIEQHTGRSWNTRSVYDIALTFGRIRRKQRYENKNIRNHN